MRHFFREWGRRRLEPVHQCEFQSKKAFTCGLTGSSLLTLFRRTRLETLVQVPICKRAAIHVRLTAVSARSCRARVTVVASLLRLSANCSSSQPSSASGAAAASAEAHLGFHFVNERFFFTDLRLDLARRAEERAEFLRHPAGEGGLVLVLKAMPFRAYFFEAGHGLPAVGACGAPQRFLIDDDDVPQPATAVGRGRGRVRFFRLARHWANCGRLLRAAKVFRPDFADTRCRWCATRHGAAN